jgi:hypothetical protein
LATNILYAFLFSPIRATCPAHLGDIRHLKLTFNFVALYTNQ